MRSTTELRKLMGARLRMVMAYRQVSARMLARATKGKISHVSISRYMNGDGEPTFTKMALMAALLGANLEYLAYGTEPMVNPGNWFGVEPG